MKTLKTLHYCPYKIFFMKTAVGEATLLVEIKKKYSIRRAQAIK